MAPDPYRELPWAVVDIDIVRERAWRYEIVWEAGTDVSSRAWTAQVRDVPEGTLLADITVDATAAATGTVVLSMTAEDTTGILSGAWELTYTIGAGDPVTLMRGVVTATGWVVS